MNSTLYCSKCGRVNTRSREICTGCGALLNAEYPLARQSAAEVTPNREVESDYTYLTVPFMGQLNHSLSRIDNAYHISQQLQQLIDDHGRLGWDFYRIEKVNVQVEAGCLGFLFGNDIRYVTYEQVIFRRTVEKA